MWAITSYFNPANYRRRLTNYRIFRWNLGIPLVTVELSFGCPFQLDPNDADILIQLHGGDLMWQKERLLNIALSHVPASCEHVAWLDADVLFPDPEWHMQATELLRRFATIHLFQSAYELPADYPESGDRSRKQPAGESVVYLVNGCGKHHLLTDEHYAEFHRGHFRSGMAWAARTDILRRHGLYDACVVGGGDTAWHAMSVGRPDLAILHMRMNPRWRDHYLEWAGGISEAVQGNVGWLPAELNHLWHGNLQNRKSTGRYKILEGFEFDPGRDLAPAENGCWKWNSSKPELHAWIPEYFASRREDDAEDQPA